jgi:putative ABC transport system substrate-binding protein
VAFVHTLSPSTALPGTATFWDRLRELGWIQGENLIVEQRWADGQPDRLPALMAEVIERKVDVLVTYGTPAAIAAKRATNTVPIVIAVMGDAVRSGLVESLAHPGGNLTGLSIGVAEGMAGKWLELLRETVPRLSTVAIIANPANVTTPDLTRDIQAMAPMRRLKIVTVDVRRAEELDRAFERARRQAQAVVVLVDPITTGNRPRVAALAAKHKLPVVYPFRDLAEAGGLMSYGPDLNVMFRRAAEYVDRILKGAKPADLPIEQPTKFELVINLKTAKALGIIIPESILLRADEVIR